MRIGLPIGPQCLADEAVVVADAALNASTNDSKSVHAVVVECQKNHALARSKEEAAHFVKL
jgi:hypothetical protein